jgi:hypothetical protein
LSISLREGRLSAQRLDRVGGLPRSRLEKKRSSSLTDHIEECSPDRKELSGGHIVLGLEDDQKWAIFAQDAALISPRRPADVSMSDRIIFVEIVQFRYQLARTDGTIRLVKRHMVLVVVVGRPLYLNKRGDKFNRGMRVDPYSTNEVFQKESRTETDKCGASLMVNWRIFQTSPSRT